MSAADDLVLAIRLARADGKSEPDVQAIVHRLAGQYPTADLKAAQAQLVAELEAGQ
ncbi:hypothetical protein [Streptomyces kaempferi]|uniref:Uncharacterized protein n=1 Tax=Streptomyces kaempferi TaxID=333725 RepID=A0ABW3XJQ1_9ACTN